MKANGETLLTSHKSFTKGVNSELQHAFGMFDANMQDIIKQLTFVINSIHDSIQDVPQIMGEDAAQYTDQMKQLTRYMEHTQRMLEDAIHRMSRGGGQ